MTRAQTIPERICTLETETKSERETNSAFRIDVNAHLRRIEKIIWFLVGLEAVALILK